MYQGATYAKTIYMITEICCNCGIAFGLPSDLHGHLQNDPNKSFYCPNGHGQHYSKSREQRLREKAEAKLKQKDQQLADADIAKKILQADLDKMTRKLKRVQNGVCPYPECKRHFNNLARHIQTKHTKKK